MSSQVTHVVTWALTVAHVVTWALTVTCVVTWALTLTEYSFFRRKLFKIMAGTGKWVTKNGYLESCIY
jgi:hypothetical protein